MSSEAWAGRARGRPRRGRPQVRSRDGHGGVCGGAPRDHPRAGAGPVGDHDGAGPGPVRRRGAGHGTGVGARRRGGCRPGCGATSGTSGRDLCGHRICGGGRRGGEVAARPRAGVAGVESESGRSGRRRSRGGGARCCVGWDEVSLRPGERGSATVLVLAGVGVAVMLLTGGLALGSAVTASHRARAAADLGALAAAQAIQRGAASAAACSLAASVMERNGGRSHRCEVAADGSVTTTALTTPSYGLPGTRAGTTTATARAGPVPATARAGPVPATARAAPYHECDRVDRHRDGAVVLRTRDRARSGVLVSREVTRGRNGALSHPRARGPRGRRGRRALRSARDRGP